MIDFSIQLKGGDTKDALALLVAYSKEFTGHRFMYSTGLKVSRSSFNAAKPGKQLKDLIQKAEDAYKSLKVEGSPVNNESLKARVTLFRNRLQWIDNELHIYNGATIERHVVNDGVSRPQLEKVIKTELTKAKPNTAKVINGVLSDGTNELFGFWQGVIDGTIKPRAGKVLRKSTLKNKRQTLKLVKDFNPLASFDKMDMKFYNSFTGWMSKEQEIEREDKVTGEKIKITKAPFDSNTIGKHIKDLKAILHLAYRNELLDNDRFRYWSVTKESNEVVALSKDEVLKINGLELSGTKADVRDVFVLACFLGLRISDYKQFKKEALETTAGVTFFSYVQEKTGTRVKIPVHPIALSILEKRNGEFPKMIAEQNFRAYIKDICEAAKLNDRVVTKIRDGKPEYKKKWEAISPHSARRTFASSLFYGWFSKPMPASLCMRYTGHRTEKSFLLYIGASEKELNEKALEYFDVQPQMKVS